MIGYVLSRFPALSTTFVLNELLELEARGLAVHLFSMTPPTDTLVHEDLRRLKARLSYVPGIGKLGRLLSAHAELRRESRAAYGATLREVAGRGDPRRFWRFLQAGYIAAAARRLGLAHLHAHFANHPTTTAMLASSLSGIPFSFTAHAVDLYKDNVSRDDLARKAAAARFVVTVSRYNLEFLESLAPGVRDKLVLARCGIDLDRFAPRPLPPQPSRLLCVARLVIKKGVGTLIEACRLLRDRGVALECEIVGEGPLRRKLEAQVREAGLGDRVRFSGPATQLAVRERYAAAHFFVLPCIIAPDGDRDGLPIAILEALACGLPVISTPVAGIPEVLRHGANALLVPPGDPPALAEAVARLLSDPLLYHRLAANARVSVEPRFERRHAIAALLSRFQESGA
jgi:glycosyltransferase involved in cell wall biosynthesis